MGHMSDIDLTIRTAATDDWLAIEGNGMSCGFASLADPIGALDLLTLWMRRGWVRRAYIITADGDTHPLITPEFAELAA